MYEGREVFANPSLEYVAAEVRFPYTPKLRQAEVRDSLLTDLEDVFPIPRQVPQVLVMANGQALAQGPANADASRAVNRSNTIAVTVTVNSLTVDTTRYREYSDFRSVVERCVQAVDARARVAAVERLGLRYINEVRVPVRIADVRDWRTWITDDLINIVDVDRSHAAVLAQGAVQYRVGDDRNLAFRFAASPEGEGVIGNDPLRRRTTAASGPFFVLDLDSYWQPPQDNPGDWDCGALLTMMDALHAPIGVTFQKSITDRLRDEVLRRAQ